MDDNELKNAISSKLGDVLSGRSLSADFCSRLRISARRLRYLRMLKIAIVLAVIAAFSLATLDFISVREGLSPEKAQLVAAKQPQEEPNPQLSKLAFLGFFRECFKRGKTTKRKEED